MFIRLLSVALLALSIVACASTPTPTPDAPDGSLETPDSSIIKTAKEDPVNTILKSPTTVKKEDDMFGGAVKNDKDDFAPSDDSFKAPTKKKGITVAAKPEVTIGASIIKGDLDKDSAAKSVRNKEGAIKKCFKERIDSKGAKGSIMVTFKLKRTGGVTDVKKTKSTLSDEAIDACVIKAIKTVVIPGGKGDVSIIQPIFFSAP